MSPSSGSEPRNAAAIAATKSASVTASLRGEERMLPNRPGPDDPLSGEDLDLRLGVPGPCVAEKDGMDEQARVTQVAVSTALHCIECRQEWTDPHERWRMYSTLDEEPEVGLFCPACAAFEFDA